MPKYLALTIGPIYRTMQQARKTRELWAASYMFSFLMRQLMDQFKVHGTIIAPCDMKASPQHGAGIWPDRLFVKLTNDAQLSNLQIETAIEKAIRGLASATNITEEKLQKYLQIYSVQGEAANPLIEMNKYLDALELQPKSAHDSSIDWGEVWDMTKTRNFFDTLYEKGYQRPDILPEVGSDRRFVSIPEVATKELEVKYMDEYWKALGCEVVASKGHFGRKLKRLTKYKEEEDEIIEALKIEFPDDFMARHKYFCIIQADGDKVGALIKQLATDEQQTKFSETLTNVSIKASEILVSFGAFPVYIGGDDLLFFAPITGIQNADVSQAEGNEEVPTYFYGENKYLRFKNSDGKWQHVENIFQLMNLLNDQFKDAFHEFPGSAVSLSFGVNICYYKHPMNEVLENAYELLFHTAKKFKGKNAIAFEVQKHSGQIFKACLGMQTPVYKSFMNLFSAHVEDKFLNSVMYKLGDQKFVLATVGDNTERLAHFFDNNFNESGHDKHRKFFADVSQLINAVFVANPVIVKNGETASINNTKLEENLNTIYSCLRFIQFLNAPDNE